jgi:hypothetical protein
MALVAAEDLIRTAWNSHPPSHITQNIGDMFVRNNKHLKLKVPSAVVA